MQISTLNLKEFHNSKIKYQRSLYKGNGVFSFLYMSKKFGKTLRISIYCRYAVRMKQSLLVQFCEAWSK